MLSTHRGHKAFWKAGVPDSRAADRGVGHRVCPTGTAGVPQQLDCHSSSAAGEVADCPRQCICSTGAWQESTVQIGARAVKNLGPRWLYAAYARRPPCCPCRASRVHATHANPLIADTSGFLRARSSQNAKPSPRRQARCSSPDPVMSRAAILQTTWCTHSRLHWCIRESWKRQGRICRVAMLFPYQKSIHRSWFPCSL